MGAHRSSEAVWSGLEMREEPGSEDIKDHAIRADVKREIQTDDRFTAYLCPGSNLLLWQTSRRKEYGHPI